ncbi:MAG: flagellar hook-length control protein FliK [Syntrophales bacterium]
MAEVIDTARPLAQQGGGRIRINLNPPSLGALEIDIRVRKEGVELFMVANNSDVQQTLCSHADQLRKALVEQGLNMDRFQVVVGDHADGQQWRDPRQEGASSGHREAWNEQGYLPGLDGDSMNDEMGKRTSSGSYSSVGVINLFI